MAKTELDEAPLGCLEIGISLDEQSPCLPVFPIRLSKQWDFYDALAFLQDALWVLGASQGYDRKTSRDPVDFVHDLRNLLLAERPSSLPLPRYVRVSLVPKLTKAASGESRRSGIAAACYITLANLINAPAEKRVRDKLDTGLAGITAFLTDVMPPCQPGYVLNRDKHIPPFSEAKLPKLPRGRPPKPREMNLEEVKQEAQVLQGKLDPHKEAMLHNFQEWLDGLHQKGACPSYSQNKALAELVMKKAKGNGFILLCRGEEDGKLHVISGIYCEQPDSKSGIFGARLPGGTPVYTKPMFPQLYARIGS
jgi:hypothetical protein